MVNYGILMAKCLVISRRTSKKMGYEPKMRKICGDVSRTKNLGFFFTKKDEQNGDSPWGFRRPKKWESFSKI